MTQPEALRLADALMTLFPSREDGEQAAAELRRLHAEVERLSWDSVHTCHSECQRPVCKLTRERDALLEALKGMEARFGCESSRSETKPKTYGCRHMAETCGNCYGLVTGWMAVQAARAAIKAVEEKA